MVAPSASKRANLLEQGSVWSKILVDYSMEANLAEKDPPDLPGQVAKF
jgi:hypothetical protein